MQPTEKKKFKCVTVIPLCGSLNHNNIFCIQLIVELQLTCLTTFSSDDPSDEDKDVEEGSLSSSGRQRRVLPQVPAGVPSELSGGSATVLSNLNLNI